jgi:hypothetical protein
MELFVNKLWIWDHWQFVLFRIDCRLCGYWIIIQDRSRRVLQDVKAIETGSWQSPISCHRNDRHIEVCEG